MLKQAVNNHQSGMKDCNVLICPSVYSFLLSFIILLFLSFHFSLYVTDYKLRTSRIRTYVPPNVTADEPRAVPSLRRFVVVLSLRKPELDSRPVHMRFVLGAGALENDLLLVLHLLLVSTIPPTRCPCSFIYHRHHIISVNSERR